MMMLLAAVPLLRRSRDLCVLLAAVVSVWAWTTATPLLALLAGVWLAAAYTWATIARKALQLYRDNLGPSWEPPSVYAATVKPWIDRRNRRSYPKAARRG